MSIDSKLVLRRAKDLEAGDTMKVDARDVVVSDGDHVAYVPMNLEEVLESDQSPRMRLTRLNGTHPDKALFSAVIPKGCKLSYRTQFQPTPSPHGHLHYWKNVADRPDYYYRISSIRVVNPEAV